MILSLGMSSTLPVWVYTDQKTICELRRNSKPKIQSVGGWVVYFSLVALEMISPRSISNARQSRNKVSKVGMRCPVST